VNPRGDRGPLVIRHGLRHRPLEPAQTFERLGNRVDRAAHRLRPAGRGPEGPQRHAQVLEKDHRLTRLDRHRPAQAVLPPTAGRAGDHDVAAVRVEKCELEPRQAGKVSLDRVGPGTGSRRCPTPQRRVEVDKRDLPQP
jgi:hypothetical protein